MMMTASFVEEKKEGLAPASKESIKALPTVCGDEMDCSICLENLKKLTVKEISCRHRFHGDCLDKWLGMHGSYSLCRILKPSNDGYQNT